MDAKTGQAGVIVAPDGANSLDKMAHAITDDLLYNIVHDLLLKVHQEEKTAKANSAAIRVEKLAYDSSDPPNVDERPEIRIETATAIYNHGEIYTKGNPLKNTEDILCPRCHLPRLLYPVEGKGSRKPDPGVIYCKKHPFIDKPNCDIYGQTWVGPGPGRGKKKKDVEKKTDANSSDPNNPDGRPTNLMSFPSATCSKCKRCILVTRLNNHMGSCIGNSGRNSSRAAAQKINNGNGDGTSPSSQKGTPVSGSRASSPKKREADVLLDEDSESESGHRKKKLKPTTLKKSSGLVKTKGPKKEKVKTASLLSNEHKLDDDDDAAAVTATEPTSITKTTIAASAASTATAAAVASKKASPIMTKGMSPALKNKKLKLGSDKPRLASPLHKVREATVDSESSGTLSSPPR